MTWKDVTVWQFQQLEALKRTPGLTEVDIAAKAVEIMYDMTERQVDSLSMDDFNKLSKGLNFLATEPIPHAPAQYIDVNGRRYKCIYDLRKLKAGRYLEAKSFGGDIIGNLHKIAASMVSPMKRVKLKPWRWEHVNYDASNHELYADDMLHAPFLTVYNSVLFFCAVYAKTMQLEATSMEQTKTATAEAREALRTVAKTLCELSAGYFKAP